jgi:hypothetical protein
VHGASSLAALALEAVRRKREELYDRFVQPFDRSRDELTAEVAERLNALSEARRILGAIEREFRHA